jgi:putative spermidine/putrescine transport system permease protein
MESGATRFGLAVWATLVVLFLWAPLVLIGVYAFNESNIQSWPLPGVSLKWFGEAWDSEEVRNAFWLSIKAGLGATGAAILLGSLLSFGLYRFRFFGRDAISFLFVLPIALPGIITGMSLNRFFSVAGFDPSLWTIVIGHATFCMVIVFNNVIARLRRTSPSLVEASLDLGADGWQTFRYVTWPTIATALVAGSLLAFALSFDEVIVTYFTAGANNTLPLLIFGYIRNGLHLPVVNVVVLVVILLTVIPVTISVRLTRDPGVIRRR